MDAKKNMSQRVKAYRKSKYNSIEAFSEDLGIALNTVRKLERAHGNPTMDTMNLVADKLGITVSELLSPPASGQEQNSQSKSPCVKSPSRSWRCRTNCKKRRANTSAVWSRS